MQTLETYLSENLEYLFEDEIFFDIETLKLSHEVPGGWDRIQDFGVAVVVTWDRTNGFREWFEKDVEKLVNELEAYESVVTFNGERFDFQVLSGYLSVDHLFKKSFDLLVAIKAACGHRVSLDSVGADTLKIRKSGDGLQAVKWWREGRQLKVVEYCRDDVALLASLIVHARKEGGVKVDGGLLRIPSTRPQKAKAAKK